MKCCDDVLVMNTTRSKLSLTTYQLHHDNSQVKIGFCGEAKDSMKYVDLVPPLEFQDQPLEKFIEKFAIKFIAELISEAFEVSCKMTWSIPCSQVCHTSSKTQPHHSSVIWNGLRLCWTPELFASNKKNSGALSTCLSSSHNSLSTISSSNMDMSDHIKSAISHDVLSSKHISDMYNVPFDSDIYALPIDVVRGGQSKPFSCRGVNGPVKTERFSHSVESESDLYASTVNASRKSNSSQKWGTEARNNVLVKRPQFSSMTSCSAAEPIHVTVDDVRRYLKSLYVHTNDSLETVDIGNTMRTLKNPFKTLQNNRNSNNNNNNNIKNEENRLNSLKSRRSTYIVGSKSEKAKEYVRESVINGMNKIDSKDKLKKWSNLKETLCNIFRLKRLPSPNQCLGKRDLGLQSDQVGIRLSGHEDQNPPSPITKPPFSKRALPPLPRLEDSHGEIIVTDSTPLPSPEEVPSPSAAPLRSKDPPGSVDFASSIEKVKDCGWYWGPISGEAAEKILSGEPDGSFIVRDSSDDYYIFSLTFKLNSIIRHVRIEHDQGNFSFGSSTRFKSHTIVDFIESAVEHSRSGRYLFFLHRRPVLGPMRVQLLHPVSRFKQVQSLQHMCRFVILKMVRRDHIRYLPLPRRILDYLSTPHYYSETLAGDDQSDSSTTRNDEPNPIWPDPEGFS